MTTDQNAYRTAPTPQHEAAIALSIAFVAAEILHSRQGRPGLTERYPWIVAFTFGLLHGFGFASALTKVGLPQTEMPMALLFFNVGGGELASRYLSPPCLPACGWRGASWGASSWRK